MPFESSVRQSQKPKYRIEINEEKMQKIREEIEMTADFKRRGSDHCQS